MKDFFDKAMTWVKANWMIALGILFAVIILFFPKLLKGLTGTTRRRRRRIVSIPTLRRRSLPRSVGLTRRGIPRKQYTKGGKAKKPWQIKGSLAARRHMAQIRRMR